MAKIIKHGNMYNKEVTCPRCGCVFVPDKKDIRYPEIDFDKVPDDGNVHLSPLKYIKDLPIKNSSDVFYINAEMFETITPRIICPECGESKVLRTDLVMFDEDNSIIVSDDPLIIRAIEEDLTDDDSPAWDVLDMLVLEGTYRCLKLNIRTSSYLPVNLNVLRPDPETHKSLYEKIKEKLNIK